MPRVEAANRRCRVIPTGWVIANKGSDERPQLQAMWEWRRDCLWQLAFSKRAESQCSLCFIWHGFDVRMSYVCQREHGVSRSRHPGLMIRVPCWYQEFTSRLIRYQNGVTLRSKLTVGQMEAVSVCVVGESRESKFSILTASLTNFVNSMTAETYPSEAKGVQQRALKDGPQEPLASAHFRWQERVTMMWRSRWVKLRARTSAKLWRPSVARRSPTTSTPAMRFTVAIALLNRMKTLMHTQVSLASRKEVDICWAMWRCASAVGLAKPRLWMVIGL